MANELSITAALTFSKNAIQQFARAVTSLPVSVGSNGGVYDPGFSCSTGDQAIPLGGIPSLGYAWFHNLDATNSVNIKTASAGTVIITMKPGEVALFRFGSGVSVPAVNASSGTPLVEYVILPN